jgi:hypothetical protein
MTSESIDTKEYVNPSEIGDKARAALVSSYSDEICAEMALLTNR